MSRARRKDLTGLTFGSWTVLYVDGDNPGSTNIHARWICMCSCGIKRSVSGSNLRRGQSISCDCSRRIDLMGQTFDRWTVVSFSHMDTTAQWNVICACGTVAVMSKNRLEASGSCGCAPYEAAISRRTSPEPDAIAGARWIQLTRGKFVLVDEEDFEHLSAHNWNYNSGGYAVRDDLSGSVEILHCVVACVPSSRQVDHRNGNRLDCRKSNLRSATQQQNTWNRRKTTRHCTSKYKGVSLRENGTWRSSITKDRAVHFLGYYATDHEAAVAYDCAAIHHFGEFAKTNFDWSKAA